MYMNINSLDGRITAAKKAEWQRFLIDRPIVSPLDDCDEIDDGKRPIKAPP